MGLLKNIGTSVERFFGKAYQTTNNINTTVSDTSNFITKIREGIKNWGLPTLNVDTNVKVDYLTIGLIAVSVLLIGRFVFSRKGKKKFYKPEKKFKKRK